MTYDDTHVTWQAYRDAIVDVDLGLAGKATLAPEGQLSGELWSPAGGEVHVIAAWNPSHAATAEENSLAHTRLIALLDARGLRWHPAIGRSRGGEWGEVSAAVEGLPTNEALVIGRRFGQDAIVRRDGTALTVIPCRG